MTAATRRSIKSVAAFLTGLAAVVSGFLTLGSQSDLFVIPIVVFCVLSGVLGICARIEIKRSGGALRGKALADWGMVIAGIGFAAGFLLLPAT